MTAETTDRACLEPLRVSLNQRFFTMRVYHHEFVIASEAESR